MKTATLSIGDEIEQMKLEARVRLATIQEVREKIRRELSFPYTKKHVLEILDEMYGK